MTEMDFFEPDNRMPNNPVVPERHALVQVKERAGLAGVETHLVQSVDDAVKLMSWLGERREVLAVDTETTGFNPYAPDAKIRLIQFGDCMTGWSIPAERWGGVADEVLKKYEGELVFHNSAFDVRWMQAHMDWKAPWHRLHDTMIGAHIIDPTQSVALKNLGVRLVDRRANAGEQLLKEAFAKNKWSWDTVPVDFDAYWAYGALDTVITARIHELHQAHRRYPSVYELEMGVRRVCSNMEDNGSPIDVDFCQEKFDALSQYVDRTKAWFMEEFGIKVSSNAQLVKWFESLGATIERTTKSGAPSCDKYQLKLLMEQFPLAKVILDMRKADKLAGTYFKNFLEKNVGGVLHPSIRTLGARTGRMSMTDPALQTLPKGEATVRDAFIGREGEVIVTADYAQIEMRLMAHFAQDEPLAAAFRKADASGGDFFVELGKDIYQDANFTKADKRRGLVKNTLYGAAYGAGTAKMAETAGVPFDVMKGVADAVFHKYPGIKRLQESTTAVGKQRFAEEGLAYTVTPFGRRLPADEGREYALVNYLLQGHAAEVLKAAIVRADLAGLGDYLLMPVHDELVMSVPAEDAEDAKKALVEAMTVTEGYAVPLYAEGEGPMDRWGDKYAVKDSARPGPPTKRSPSLRGPMLELDS